MSRKCSKAFIDDIFESAQFRYLTCNLFLLTLANMVGHIHSGLVLLLILGLGMTSSYIIDDPYPSNKEMETVEDMTDEMTKLDEMSARGIDKKREQQLEKRDAKTIVETKADALRKGCQDEAEKEYDEKMLAEKEEGKKNALLKHYISLQHGEKSLQEGKEWLQAKQSESITVCLVRQLCEEQGVLAALGLSPSR